VISRQGNCVVKNLQLLHPLILATIGAITLLVGGSFAVSAGASTTRDTAVAVVVCSTKYGYVPPPPTSVPPRSITTSLPTKFLGRATYYTDSSGVLTVLGPKGWQCNAEIGADGSGALIIYPRNEEVPLGTLGLGWRLSPGSNAEAITASESGGSLTQASAEACSYFTSAAKATRLAFGPGCPRPPSREEISRTSTGTVLLKDPPGLHGGGMPSGGRFAAISVLSYSQQDRPALLRATCVLSSKRRSLCNSVIELFMTDNH